MSTKEIENLWWASLTHGGLLITPARLAESFSADLEPLDRRIEERLRRDITRLSEDEKSIGQLLDTVFEQVLGMKVMSKESAVDKTWSRKLLTGEQFRPNRLWLGAHGDVFPIFVVRGRGEATPRLGVGRGRREVSKVLEWLRLANQKVGLLTNGQQFRLIHAGADYEAWCEWDTDFWFEEGRPGPQLEALRRLVHVDVIRAPQKDKASVLVEAILASRRGQAQLSGVLGERVRQAVETLIRASAPVIEPLLNGKKKSVAPNEVYIAATRIVMRLVVVLFAEARDLLPRDNPLYHSSYGLQGLREELDRAAGGRGNRLRQRLPSAWPRLLALFRLVSQGSGHEELPIPAYGGDLFAAGNSGAGDGISRALAALESADNQIRDDIVHQVLDYLTRSPVKVRQGRASTVVMQPVAFSDLSSEYIGILYEGLLDYELKPVQASDGCMVFLNIGDEPALPISRLERMDEKTLMSLFEKLKANKSEDEEEEDGDDESTAEGESAADDVDDGGAVDAGIADESDAHREAVARVGKWAKKAVVAAGLVKVRKGREPDAADLADAQRKLVRRVLPAGEWFLVRWGGTRKGAGTFYTRPQLASPTVRRTLQPLAYDVVREEQDERTGLMEPVEWAPKKPEEILSLKVCDPAMGSGSFLVSALRFLTQALLESLYHHGRLDAKGPARTVCRLADGAVSGHPREELLPVPLDAPDFQERLRSRLKRHVVECCIYGVDLDPVAVELARLALWIETMNPQLPFEFLDHKLKCGNALVGCWFDRFQDYPIAAWERKGGDEAHTRFVNHFRTVTKTSGKNKGKSEKSGDKWDAAITEMAASRIYPELASVIREQVQPSFTFGAGAATAAAVHDAARKALEQMQRLAVHEVERRAELYVARYRDNDAVRQLRERFDAWCALWFWPGDRLELAPSPREFAKLSDASLGVVTTIAAQHRFFHWELEFPDVFTKEGAGFDAVLGNPPWDIQKPNSKEFFSNFDPLYRAYGKQEALEVQSELFKGAPDIERAWIQYQAAFKARSNWVRLAGRPFGDPADAPDEKGLSLSKGTDSAHLHGIWRQLRRRRKGFSDPKHPYTHQGTADTNTYKLFLEQAFALLGHNSRLGLLIPSGIYTDKGSAPLRELALRIAEPKLLHGFENRQDDGSLCFNIHSRFKFVVLILRKAQQPSQAPFPATFRDTNISHLETTNNLLPLSWSNVQQYSPTTTIIPEFRVPSDKTIADKIAGSLSARQKTPALSNGIHVTAKRALLKPANSELVPVLDGKNIHQYTTAFSPTDKSISHAGAIQTIGAEVLGATRLAMREVTGNYNERTIITCLLPAGCAHTYNLRTFSFGSLLLDLAQLAIANSLCFDWYCRLVTFLHTSVPLPDYPWPRLSGDDIQWLATRAAKLVWPRWALPVEQRDAGVTDLRDRMALRCEIDAYVAKKFGLTRDELVHVLSGFPLVDKGLPEGVSIREWVLLAFDGRGFGAPVFANVTAKDGYSIGLDDQQTGWRPAETTHSGSAVKTRGQQAFLFSKD